MKKYKAASILKIVVIIYVIKVVFDLLKSKSEPGRSANVSDNFLLLNPAINKQEFKTKIANSYLEVQSIAESGNYYGLVLLVSDPQNDGYGTLFLIVENQIFWTVTAKQ